MRSHLDLKGSDDGVWHSESLGLRTLSSARNSKQLENNFSETESVFIFRWLMLALSKEPNGIDVSSSPKDGIRSSFRNVFSGNLEFRTMDKILSPNDSEGSSEYTIYGNAFQSRHLL
jgi:hypothetical protein